MGTGANMPEAAGDWAKEIWAGIAAELRPLGYSRRGLYARKLTPDGCAVIQLQRSRDSTRLRAKFTLNLGVAYERLLEPPVAEGAIKRADFRDVHVQARIGSLMPVPDDRWWLIGSRSECDRVQLDLKDALWRYGLPYIDRYCTLETAIHDWKSGLSTGQTEGDRKRLLARLGFPT